MALTFYWARAFVKMNHQPQSCSGWCGDADRWTKVLVIKMAGMR